MDDLSQAFSHELGEVFISYSWDTEDHVGAVLKLSNRLRSDGIDSVLDQYEVSPPEGWPRWMDRKISSASLVIVICTEMYLNRVMGRETPGKGNGVRWEGGLIYQHLYNQGADNLKVIPVLMNASDERFIPVPLQGSSHFVVDTDAGYEKLYARLFDLPLAERPPLGARKAMPEKEVKTDIASYMRTPIDMELWEKAQWRGALFAIMPGVPPMLGLAFLERGPAEEIFKGWRERYGVADRFEELRISIVEGDVLGEDPGYTVTVGLNLEKVFERYRQAGLEIEDPRFFTTLTRLNRMTPQRGSPYLSRFKQAVQEDGEFLLIPAVISPDGSSPQNLIELGIRKKLIYFRTITDIGPADIDSIVLDTGSQERELTDYGESIRNCK